MARSAQTVFRTPVFLSYPVRTAIGKFGGGWKALTAPELASIALAELLRRQALELGALADDVPAPDAVYLGHARQAGAGPNPARQCTIRSGLPDTVPAVTFNQACASGLASVIAACDRIQTGKARTIVAGGVESMTQTPYYLMQARWGQRLGHAEAVDGMRRDGFFCPMAQMLMGETVDRILAPEFKISRSAQDAFALESQRRAAAAWSAGHFRDEVADLHGPGQGATPGASQISTDEHVRAETTLESLSQLPPVFSKSGTVTAGNSSGITDGAAFVQVSSERPSAAVAEVLDYEVVALDPARMGLGPVPATQALLARQKLAVQDLDAVELNEAFAAQVLACQRSLHIPEDRLNAWGGAIALGHPIGATGTRILVTLLSRLRGRPGALGLATLCVSGGMGVAVLVRALK